MNRAFRLDFIPESLIILSDEVGLVLPDEKSPDSVIYRAQWQHSSKAYLVEGVLVRELKVWHPACVKKAL